MSIDAQILQEIVDDVCAGMLGLGIQPLDGVDGLQFDTLTAVVRVSGGWNSLVQVLASRKTARVIASTMFATNEDHLTEEDIIDAVGEIVNMIGGNLKGVVEAESRLSLPCVGSGSNDELIGDDLTAVTVFNRCRGETLVVRCLDQRMGH